MPIVTVLTAADEDEPPGLAPLHEAATVHLASDESALREHLPETDILLVTDFRTEAFRAAWPAAERLQWVHATSAGVDAVLFSEIVESEVVITNARGIFDRAIAEYVLGVILMFAKDSKRNIQLQRDKQWRHRETERIADKRVLIVGAGSIGHQIADICSAVGMDAHGIARSAREHDPPFTAVHAIDDLKLQLREADYVVVAAPLTPDTRGLFGAAEFNAMAPHARFINIGRGPIVDTQALVDALRQERIAGAGLDVFEEEPVPANHPLWNMDNVLMSAHMAGDFIGWKTALTQQFLDNFERWQSGEKLNNIVDKKRGYVPPSS